MLSAIVALARTLRAFVRAVESVVAMRERREAIRRAARASAFDRLAAATRARAKTRETRLAGRDAGAGDGGLQERPYRRD